MNGPGAVDEADGPDGTEVTLHTGGLFGTAAPAGAPRPAGPGLPASPGVPASPRVPASPGIPASPRVPTDPPGLAPPGCDAVVIGCGNLLRGDDGVGPILVRRLAETGVPPGVRVVDGGTAGMDAAFAMRGARRVVVVDAARTGSPPGTVFRVPGAELADLSLDPRHPHAFRWDHSLAFGRWLLGDDYPDEVEVYLIEAGGLEPGADLTASVRRAMERVLQMIIDGLRTRPTDRTEDTDIATPATTTTQRGDEPT